MTHVVCAHGNKHFNSIDEWKVTNKRLLLEVTIFVGFGVCFWQLCPYTTKALHPYFFIYSLLLKEEYIQSPRWKMRSLAHFPNYCDLYIFSFFFLLVTASALKSIRTYLFTSQFKCISWLPRIIYLLCFLFVF